LESQVESVSVSDELLSSAVSNNLVLEGHSRELSQSVEDTGTHDKTDLTVTGE